jgi:hemerythrin-like domain-containing protein
MEATNILQQEHRVIERVLASMEAGANFLEIGESVEPEFFLKAVEFFKGFTDGCHHMKEEEVLFVKMAEHGIAVENGPLGVMYSEHELGRMYLHTIREIAETIRTGKAHSPELLLENVRGYIDLYHKHIVKETECFFRLQIELSLRKSGFKSCQVLSRLQRREPAKNSCRNIWRWQKAWKSQPLDIFDKRSSPQQHRKYFVQIGRVT